MTATTPPTPLSSEKRSGLPPVVAFLIIAAIVGLAGWGVWSFYQGLGITRDGAVVATDEPPSQYRQNAWSDRMRVQAVNQMNQEDYVRNRPRNQGGGWEVKGNRTRLIIQRGNNQLRLTAESMDPNFVTPEQRTLLALRTRAVGEEAVAKHIELTPEQRQELNQIPRGMNHELDDALRKTLESLFTAWDQATGDAKNAAAQQLIDAVREIDTSLSATTKQSIAGRASRVKEILTADQVRKFQEMGRGR
jgi:hypothetical protein